MGELEVHHFMTEKVRRWEKVWGGKTTWQTTRDLFFSWPLYTYCCWTSRCPWSDQPGRRELRTWNWLILPVLPERGDPAAKSMVRGSHPIDLNVCNAGPEDTLRTVGVNISRGLFSMRLIREKQLSMLRTVSDLAGLKGRQIFSVPWKNKRKHCQQGTKPFPISPSQHRSAYWTCGRGDRRWATRQIRPHPRPTGWQVPRKFLKWLFARCLGQTAAINWQSLST
jgi:hypothetical protein